jgi:putative flippase GtrA
MAKQVAGEGPGEMHEPMRLEATAPLPARQRSTANRPLASAVTIHSYRPTGWTPANHVLDLVDEWTGGKAEWFQRVFSYLFIGGFAAMVNLAVFYVMLYRVPLAVSDSAHYIIGNIVAAEISIFANFIPNDRITFRHLPGHSRSWIARCARFHVTAIAGTIVTLVISFLLHRAGLPGIVPQAIAIIIALAFNFTFHHVFTYRHP